MRRKVYKYKNYSLRPLKLSKDKVSMSNNFDTWSSFEKITVKTRKKSLRKTSEFISVCNWNLRMERKYQRNIRGKFVHYAGNFTCLEIVFTFRRRLGYYLFHTYVPTCLIVIMSWISFWIKPEAVPARVRKLGIYSRNSIEVSPLIFLISVKVSLLNCKILVY